MEKSRRRRRFSDESKDKSIPAIQTCFSGVSGAIFTITFICIDVVVFLMEGPFLYLNIIYSLYVLVIAAFVFQILLDLGVWECTKSGSPHTRNFLSRLCPFLCIALSIPPAALLYDTRNRGGFSNEKADISLIFSIVIVAVEILHLIVTILMYRNYMKNIEDNSVRFSYQSGGPSPASSIRSSRIDFIMSNSRNSLASIDSGFMNTNFANMRGQRASAMDMSNRFWESQMQQQEQGHPRSGDRGSNADADQSKKRRRSKRRDSESSIKSYASSSSKASEYSFYTGGGVSQRNSGRKDSNASTSKDDFDLMDTRSIKSTGSNRSRSGRNRNRNFPGYRVEEEMVYQPGYFKPM